MNTDTRLQYLELGFDSIPLLPMSKHPAVKGWQLTDSMKQWRHARPDANIGLRAGNGKAFIDCDEKNQPGTFETVTRWLDGLGYREYPVIRTPSGGAHVYVNFSGPLLGSSQNLSSQIGAGEFKFDMGAFVAAPPSVTEVGSYQIVDGDLFHLPALDIKDIATLINVQKNQERKQEKPATVSDRAIALMQGKEILKADGSPLYATRSEADAALMLSLINTRNSLEQIKKIFQDFPTSGKYKEKLSQEGQGRADAYLYVTYKNALAYSQHTSPTRRRIDELMELANSAAWTNVTDKNVYLAHLELAYQAGKITYGASVRDLAVIAGVGMGSISRANVRLTGRKIVLPAQESDGIHSARYTLGQSGTLPKTPSVRECSDLSGTPTWKGERVATHDAFRNGKGLGQRAGEIYELLLRQPLTLDEIKQATDAHEKTITRSIKKLSRIIDRKTGEIIQPVTFDGTHYAGQIVDLDLIAAIYDSYGAREKQRHEYEVERRDRKKQLDRGSLQPQKGTA